MAAESIPSAHSVKREFKIVIRPAKVLLSRVRSRIGEHCRIGFRQTPVFYLSSRNPFNMTSIVLPS